MMGLNIHRVEELTLSVYEYRQPHYSQKYDSITLEVAGGQPVEVTFFTEANSARTILRQLVDQIEKVLADLEPAPGSIEAQSEDLVEPVSAQEERAVEGMEMVFEWELDSQGHAHCYIGSLELYANRYGSWEISAKDDPLHVALLHGEPRADSEVNLAFAQQAAQDAYLEWRGKQKAETVAKEVLA